MNRLPVQNLKRGRTVGVGLALPRFGFSVVRRREGYGKPYPYTQEGRVVARELKVSVALCTFNYAEFVGAQLESILGQSRPPDEVLVSDDGSEDDTLAIVERVAARFPCEVRVVQNARCLGCTGNFGSAIAQARGDVIFLSDPDDVWLEHRIERMLAPFAESDRVAVVYSDAFLADAQLRPTGRTIFQARRSMRLATRRSARELVHGVDIGVLGSMMALRSALRPYVLPVEATWGHDHWILFIAHAIAEVRAIDEPLMYYRRHARNTGFDRSLEGGWWKGLSLKPAADRMSGFDRSLDGGWWKEWALGARTTGMEPYAQETRRWETMVARLKELKTAGAPVESPSVLNEFIEESERRLEFARARESIKHKRRHRRLTPTARLLLRGDYHLYVHGFRTFCKDLILG